MSCRRYVELVTRFAVTASKHTELVACSPLATCNLITECGVRELLRQALRTISFGKSKRPYLDAVLNRLPRKIRSDRPNPIMPIRLVGNRIEAMRILRLND